MCVRSDVGWAPPSVLPHDAHVVYVRADAGGSAFGAAVVAHGADCERDEGAALVCDVAGRVALGQHDCAFVGAVAHTPFTAALVGVVAVLEVLTARGGSEPIVLRLADRSAAAAVAGVWEPSVEGRLRARLLKLLLATRRDRDVWVAGYAANVRYCWGERATALAALASAHGYYGELPPAWGRAAPRAPAVPPWAVEDECPVCYDAYTDSLPTPAPRSCAPPGRWALPCLHAICRECDAAVQAAHNDKCPLCRAPRRVRMMP